jgi:hypothetical protein
VCCRVGMSYLGCNPYLLNIVPLFNVADPNNGFDTAAIGTSLSNFATMIDTTTQTAYLNSIQPYAATGTGNVTMLGNFELVGGLTVNGYTVGSALDGGGTTVGGTTIEFIVGSNSVLEVDSLGRALYQGDGVSSNVNRLWVSSAILHADRAAIGLGGLSTMSTMFDVWSGDAYFNCNVHVKGDVFADNFINLSDRRVKSDIRPLEGALSTICQLQGVHYTMRGVPSVGFIAQEVQQVIPEAVHPRPDGLLAVDYNRVIPLLVEAIKELATLRQ